MFEKASRARKLLNDSSALVADFVSGKINDDGGFEDRSAKSDLYYTVFGLETLAALGVDRPADRLESYLRSFGRGESLDLVHLACLARCWASLTDRIPRDLSEPIARRIAEYRSADGGFANAPGSETGTVYASFLALGAHEDLAVRLPRADRLVETVEQRATACGGYGNEPGMAQGTTPVTAAAMIVLARLAVRVPETAVRWLLERRHESGGFVASESTPLPDLLSTATALHALNWSGARSGEFGEFREKSLDFVDSLWSGTGGFRGHWADDMLDCEYTFYGLLALGHLAE